jgi:hypothetical protein
MGKQFVSTLPNYDAPLSNFAPATEHDMLDPSSD